MRWQKGLRELGCEVSSMQFCCLTWWMYMFWPCSCSNAGVPRDEVAGHSRWSSLVALLPGVSPTKVATGQGLKCVGCFCQWWEHWLCFHEWSINLENIRTAFRYYDFKILFHCHWIGVFAILFSPGPTWLMRPGCAEQEPLVQTKGPRGRDPSPHQGSRVMRADGSWFHLTSPSSWGWEFSFGARSFLFLPWMLWTSGAFRHADSSAEEEEVAAPGRSTIKNLLGCGNESMV